MSVRRIGFRNGGQNHVVHIACLVSALILVGLENAHAAAIGLEISGVKQTFSEAALVEFNLTLLQFGGPRKDHPTDSILKLETSGDILLFQLIVTGGAIDNDVSVPVKGLFGESKIEGGNTILTNVWWEFGFTFNLKDREASEGNLSRLDEISVVNGIIQHLEAPHKRDADEGLDLVWGDLSLIANATKVGADKIRSNSLSPPLDCEDHPLKAGQGNRKKHKDCIIEGKLSGKVVDNLLGDDFESWRLEAKAEHIPEPATSGLLCLAGAALVWHRKRTKGAPPGSEREALRS